jgi:branched-chain amino acid transport system permease protein
MTSGDLNALIYGFLIIAFLLFEPGGILGLLRRIQTLARKLKIHGGEGGEPAEITELPSSADAHFDAGDSAETQEEVG